MQDKLHEPTTIDPMKIQRAHDLPKGLILGEAPEVELSQGARKEIKQALDILCWVLGHDHNVLFDHSLKSLEKKLEGVGVRILPYTQ